MALCENVNRSMGTNLLCPVSFTRSVKSSYLRILYQNKIHCLSSRLSNPLRITHMRRHRLRVSENAMLKGIFVDVRTRQGPGSSVGIATDYGLDGLGSNPGGDETFRSSRPALGSTQPPVQWVPGLSRE
jgi:hypothetical protein